MSDDSSIASIGSTVVRLSCRNEEGKVECGFTSKCRSAQSPTGGSIHRPFKRSPSELSERTLVTNGRDLKPPDLFYATEPVREPGFALIEHHRPRVADEHPQVGRRESHLQKVLL